MENTPSGLFQDLAEGGKEPFLLLAFAEERLKKCHSRLFKYCSATPENIEDFKNNKIFFNDVANFNDPFELSLGISEDEILKTVLPQIPNSDQLLTTVNQLRAYRPIVELLGKSENQGLVAKLDSLSQAEGKGAPSFGGISGTELINRLANFYKEKAQPTLADYIHFYFTFSPNSKEQMNYDAAIKEAHTKVQDVVRGGFFSLLKVSCFSEVPDSVLMWSHYASKHQGFVLQYDFGNPLENKLVETLKEAYFSLFPVQYVDSVPRPTESMTKILDKAYVSRALGDFAELLFVKNNVWSYEKEWRCWINSKEPCAHSFIKPTKIIFGASAKKELIDDCLAFAKGNGISCSQMVVDRDTYSLKEISL